MIASRFGRASRSTVARLLRPLGFSLKTNVKRLIGKQHPQRDKQYRFIQRVKARFVRRGQSVISVDAKKSELIGNFKNSGHRLCKKADEVNTYDFPSDAEYRAVPYGIYDSQANHGFVVVDTSAATSSFAVASIDRWWQCHGQLRYPNAGGVDDPSRRGWLQWSSTSLMETGTPAVR